MCQCECLSKGDGQGHPAVHHKWSRPPTRAAQHPRGVSEPIEDKRAKTTEEEKREKVRKMVLPIPNAPCLAHEPRNGPTHILTAAVWLKMSKKYFNEGTAKEACKHFDVRAKQLLRVLMGKKYLGGTQAHKRKATEEPPVRQKKDRH